MPFTYSIDRGRGWIDSVAVGAISFEDVLSLLALQQEQEIVELPALIDATNASPAFDPQEVRRIATELRCLRNAGPIGAAAIVVASDDAYSMIRMLETLAADICNVRPFRNRDEAEAWLATKAPPRRPDYVI